MNSKDPKLTYSTLSFIFSRLFLFDVFFVSFGVFFLLESRKIRPGFQQILDARIYPIVVGSIFLFTLLAHLIQLFRHRKTSDRKVDKNPLTKGIVLKISVLFGLFIAYILLIQPLGYFETGFLFLWASIALLGERSLQWIFKSFSVSFAVIIVTYFIFGVLLNIYVPTGFIFK